MDKGASRDEFDYLSIATPRELEHESKLVSRLAFL